MPSAGSEIKRRSPFTAGPEEKALERTAAESPGLLADPATLEYIISLIEDSSKNIQEQALKTIEKMYHNGVEAERITGELRRILGDRAIELLLSYAWSKKREVRISAILLLGLMKDEAAYGRCWIFHMRKSSRKMSKRPSFLSGAGTRSPF